MNVLQRIGCATEKSAAWQRYAKYLLLLTALLALAVPSFSQTSSTGALSGTVTDPSGAVIVGAAVTATNNATGAVRDTTTDSSGSYKLSVLPPGSYRVKFSSQGFKSVEVPAVTVSVTETAVLNHGLQLGSQTEQVTVEATAVTIQTENATNGGLVTSQEVTTLPLVNRNYTQIINLSPGVVANVSSAASVGNGTQDVASNGSRQNQNNYSMDGSSIVNYLSGTAAQTGSFPGMAIANPDSIQEFKVQTSQYDASSGRNSGANVDVITKTGGNTFHGKVWEFGRNNFFNANDYFYKHSEVATLHQPNKPQTLKQNTFGGTLEGPIVKNKLFFFGSYQGIRQVNGMGTSGFAAGYTPNTLLMPWDDPASPSNPRHTGDVAGYKAYLGSVFGGYAAAPAFFGSGTGVTVAANGSNISNTAIGYLQAPGVVKGGYNHGFYFPSAPAGCTPVPGAPPGLNPVAMGCIAAISQPIHANEDQYLINSQYAISSKHTLEERYLYQTDPQDQSFSCFINAGNCNPGTPINAHYFNHIAQLKLTSVLRSNLVNEARLSYHRDVENNTDTALAKSCNLSATVNVIPLVNNGAPCPLTTTPPNSLIAAKFPETNLLPMLDIMGIASPIGAWSQGGNFSMISSNFNNTFQGGDQISWTHGKHTIRAGFEAERLYHNGTIPAAERGELLMWNTIDFLTSSSGINAQDPTYNDGTPQTPGGGILLGFGLKGWLTHYNRVNAFSSYVQDDIKLTPKLTVNVGLRWEFDGYPNDSSGRFSNDWASQAAKVNTGSWFLANPQGTLVGFVAPSNYDKTYGLTGSDGTGTATGVLVNSNQTLVPGTPWKSFAPRIGLAWQPLGNKFVVRAGYGWFYDRLYGVLLIDNQLNLPPYSGAGSGAAPNSWGNTLHDPFAAGAQTSLGWTPRYVTACAPGNPISGCTFLNFGQTITSGLGYTSDGPGLADRLPLTQQYNLDFQYEIAKGWIADVGYVGSHGTHLYNWSQQINVAHLVPGAAHNPVAGPNFPNTQNIKMIQPVPFNDPANPIATQVTSNTTNGNNLNLRVSYLGFTPAGMAETNTTGDSLYNSLQAQLRHQFSHGFFLQGAFTWSKAFTNDDQTLAGSGITPPGAVLYGATNSNNPLDFRQQYGLSAFNRSKRAVITYSYDLPYHHMEGVSGHVLGGWTISGVTTIQNGQPFTIVDTAGATIYGAGGSRAALAHPIYCDSVTGNCQSGVPLASSGGKAQRVDPNNPSANWLNASAFTPLCVSGAPNACLNNTPLPASSPYCIGGVNNAGGNPNLPCNSAGSTWILGAGTGYGNSGKGAVLGPGQFNFDMVLMKNTKIREFGTLQFRVEAFNVWNHAQFNPPAGNNVNTPASFGKITSTSVTPRVFQFAMKFSF
ncbi:MAG: carboxypeptidase-like regulatory domain-containing protein [Acidobacteriia bacterium]|nr:carboxypeptidase-like regulatory domain-containing protein [Terriglobia bacterium]